MKKRTRKEKSSDQEMIERAVLILTDLHIKHPSFNACHWVSAFHTCTVQSYINSDLTYKEFCDDINRMKKHAKMCWD